ncbi:MAG: hypothetical protein AAF657_09735 [Acidobacteriota bacterium]
MADKQFFISEWKVWQRDLDDPDHPVQLEQSFCIHDRDGDAVELRFQPNFGDGCWNQHIRNARYEDGRIRADVVDDGECTPAPTANTLLIEEDTKDYANNTSRRVRCKVLSLNGHQAGPEEPVLTFDPVEKEGEFGAEDQG